MVGGESQYLDQMRQMDAYDFEQLVADVWEAQGWETKVTSRSGDRGIDIIAKKSIPVDQKILIQAKRYNQRNKLGSPEIRQYASLRLQEENVDAVVIVTTSSFSSEARDIAEDMNVKLVDGERLYENIIDCNQKIINKYFENSNKNPETSAINSNQIVCPICGTEFNSDDISIETYARHCTNNNKCGKIVLNTESPRSSDHDFNWAYSGFRWKDLRRSIKAKNIEKATEHNNVNKMLFYPAADYEDGVVSAPVDEYDVVGELTEIRSFLYNTASGFSIGGKFKSIPNYVPSMGYGSLLIIEESGVSIIVGKSGKSPDILVKFPYSSVDEVNFRNGVFKNSLEFILKYNISVRTVEEIDIIRGRGRSPLRGVPMPINVETAKTDTETDYVHYRIPNKYDKTSSVSVLLNSL